VVAGRHADRPDPGIPSTDEPQGLPSVVAGDAAIIEAVREWLDSLDRSDPPG
jgi:hypothetical protein